MSKGILVRRSNLLVPLNDASAIAECWRMDADAVTLDLDAMPEKEKPRLRKLVEAAIDDFRVSSIDCTANTIPGDLDGNGSVNGADLAILLNNWGASGAADIDGNGSTDGADLAILLNNWS